MANLNTQSFSTLVSNWAAAAQGAASQLVDFTIGSVLRAIDEATAYVALWLQGLAIQVGALTRAATSNGTDLDSWFAQFGFARLPATFATMQQSFGRFTPSAQVLITPGTSVQSADGTVVFQVIADATNANWNATLGAYVLPINTSSISVTVQCTTAGTTGNVQPNMINTLSTAISGVDYVNNAAAAVNGVNAEGDPAARSRFITWIASLEAATLVAVTNAVSALQQGMTATVYENQQYNGTAQKGYFTAIINNGSGTATSTQLTNAANAIETVRPLTVTFGCFAPTQLAVNVTMTITSAAGFTHSTVATAVQTAIASYISTVQTTSSGGRIPYTQIAAVASGVTGVSYVNAGFTINGATTDLTCTYQQAFSVGTITVS